MIVKAGILALLAILVSAPTNASGEQAFQLIRQLQDMQDGLSVGVDMPEGESDRLLTRFVNMARNRAIDWSDRRNRSALVFYLLAGGDPAPIQSILSGIAQNLADRGLIEAALSHARSPMSAKPASGGLAALDPLDAPTEAAAVVALAQARILLDSDRPVALQKLRAARALAPGGFIEDAALRQELLLLDRESDPAAVQRIALRYLNRFPKSAFLDGFIRRLEVLCEQVWRNGDSSKQAGVIVLIEELPQKYRASIALSLARSALINGQTARVAPLVKAGCANESGAAEVGERCDLYAQLAEIGKSTAYPAGSAATLRLDAVDRLLWRCNASLFGGEDRESDDVSTRDRLSADGVEENDSDLLRRVRARTDQAMRLLSGGS